MAGTISSPGIASGLDISGIVSKLMAVESQPLSLLNNKEASFQAKLTAYGSLQSLLGTLQSSAKTLADPTSYSTTSASSSDSTIATATSSSSANAGIYEVRVGQLAKAHQIHTTTSFGADTFDSGSLSINVGSGAVVNVAIGANARLADIAKAINDASTGVTAKVSNDGTADRLTLTSNTTGSAGAIHVAVATSNNDSTRRLSDLFGAENASGAYANAATDQAAQDAKFTVDGQHYTRASNTITDAVTGLTLNLQKATTDDPPDNTDTWTITKWPLARVTVTSSNVSSTGAINSFVSAYNAVITELNKDTAYDAANKKASTLTGDATARTIQSQLRNAVNTFVSGIAGGVQALSNLGITLKKDGTLSVDSTKLNTALSDSKNDVKALFSQTTTGNQGIAVRFKSIVDGMLNTGGILVARQDGLNTSVKDIGKQRDALNIRLARIQDAYLRKFNALDAVIGKMKGQQDQLTNALASLPGLVDKKK